MSDKKLNEPFDAEKEYRISKYGNRNNRWTIIDDYTTQKGVHYGFFENNVYGDETCYYVADIDSAKDKNYKTKDGESITLPTIDNAFETYDSLLQCLLDEDIISGEEFDEASEMTESLNEELELPVEPLSESELNSICKDIYNGKKGTKIVLGCFSYVRGIAANFAQGKVDKKTGEQYPLVRAIKCYESQVSTGTHYGNHQTVINRNNTDDWKARHPEDEIRDPRITEWIYPNILGKSTAGNLVFTYFPNSANRPRVKYYISIDNSNYTECSKEDIAKYMSPAAASKFLAPYEAPEDASTNVNFRMATASQIYKLHTMGNTFMMNSKTNDNIDRRAARLAASEVPADDNFVPDDDISDFQN